MTVLVAGIGNIFFGDDAFGVEVVRRLDPADLPAGTVIRDFGIRGMDLAFAMTSGTYRGVVLVDAVQTAHEPGAVVVLELDARAWGTTPMATDPHAVTPEAVMRLARSMGEVPGAVLLVGCQPREMGSDDEPVFGLSPEVEEAVARALPIVRDVVHEMST